MWQVYRLLFCWLKKTTSNNDRILFLRGKTAQFGLAGGCRHWPPVEEGSHSHSESNKLVFLAANRFAMAAAIAVHGTVGVAGQCQHSLLSRASLEASSRSPSQTNKRGMLLHFNDFPTVALLNNKRPSNHHRGWKRVPHRSAEEGKYWGHCVLDLQGQPTWARRGDNQIFLQLGAYRGQLWSCPRSPPPHLASIVPHGHVETPP